MTSTFWLINVLSKLLLNLAREISRSYDAQETSLNISERVKRCKSQAYRERRAINRVVSLLRLVVPYLLILMAWPVLTKSQGCPLSQFSCAPRRALGRNLATFCPTQSTQRQR